MTAARNLTRTLTDEALEAMLERAAEKGAARALAAKGRAAMPDAANEAPLSREAAERVDRIVREKVLRRRGRR